MMRQRQCSCRRSSDLPPVITRKMGSTWVTGNIHFTADERLSWKRQLTDGRFNTNSSEDRFQRNQLFDYVQNAQRLSSAAVIGWLPWSGKGYRF